MTMQRPTCMDRRPPPPARGWPRACGPAVGGILPGGLISEGGTSMVSRYSWLVMSAKPLTVNDQSPMSCRRSNTDSSEGILGVVCTPEGERAGRAGVVVEDPLKVVREGLTQTHKAFAVTAAACHTCLGPDPMERPQGRSAFCGSCTANREASSVASP